MASGHTFYYYCSSVATISQRRLNGHYDRRVFSHMLFVCAMFWDLMVAARRRSVC